MSGDREERDRGEERDVRDEDWRGKEWNGGTDQRLYISRLLKDDIYLFYLDSKNRVILYEFCTLCAVLPS